MSSRPSSLWSDVDQDQPGGRPARGHETLGDGVRDPTAGAVADQDERPVADELLDRVGVHVARASPTLSGMHGARRNRDAPAVQVEFAVERPASPAGDAVGQGEIAGEEHEHRPAPSPAASGPRRDGVRGPRSAAEGRQRVRGQVAQRHRLERRPGRAAPGGRSRLNAGATGSSAGCSAGRSEAQRGVHVRGQVGERRVVEDDRRRQPHAAERAEPVADLERGQRVEAQVGEVPVRRGTPPRPGSPAPPPSRPGSGSPARLLFRRRQRREPFTPAAGRVRRGRRGRVVAGAAAGSQAREDRRRRPCARSRGRPGRAPARWCAARGPAGRALLLGEREDAAVS